MLVMPVVMLTACEHRASQTEPKDREDTRWVMVDMEHLSDTQSSQIATAIESRDLLMGRLKSALMGAMQSGGPVAAIDFCQEQAPAIAGLVAAEESVKIGRTSHKLRNPSNAVPSWMEKVIEEQVVAPHGFADDAGELAVAFPITLESGCVVCHGQPEQIAPAVREAITEKYPEDQATGFTPGDLRGWLWVQVPPVD